MYPQWQDGYGDSGGYYRHEPTSSATTTIVGISGMYRGAAFPLDDDEELILGRDAMLSHIVITENAEKVSRKHVSVSFDPYDQVYTVVDHSSNGTFLADGTRLVANIPVKLKRGSVIYLAKKENSFKLT
jgi:predicted component of type VI protein secretion system